MNPVNPIVADLVSRLDDNHREQFEERAAIMEFDAQLFRDIAECLALLDVLRRHPLALAGITALQYELDGETQWLVTTDLAYAREHLADICANEAAVLDLAEVIEEQYGGVAMLTTVG
ncbi:MAG: hypothetical protein Q7T44_17895 [Parvibaculum sp.]|nr:hypothetical protein [Parvibaculum sp.]